MPKILPDNIPALRDGYRRGPQHAPETIEHDGKLYDCTSKYLGRMGPAAYSLDKMPGLRREGLPHITRSYGRNIYYYYNWKDCCAWHLGIAV